MANSRLCEIIIESGHFSHTSKTFQLLRLWHGINKKSRLGDVNTRLQDLWNINSTKTFETDVKTAE